METQDNTGEGVEKAERFADLGDMLLESYIDLRSGVGVYKKYGIARIELWVLKALAHYMRWQRSGIVNRDRFIDSLTGNNSWKHKIAGALSGLNEKGLLGSYEYIHSPGSLSISVSDLGFQLLRQHKADREKMAAKYAIYFNRPRPFTGAVYRVTDYKKARARSIDAHHARKEGKKARVSRPADQ